MSRRAEILIGDALAVLRTLPAESADCCVTDPPYGERNASWDGPRSMDWHASWLTEVARVLKPGAPVISFASRRYLDLLMGAMRQVFGDTGDRLLQTGVWVHRQGFTARAGLLRPEHEPFVVSGSLLVDTAEVRLQRAYRTAHNLNGNPTNRKKKDPRFRYGVHTYVPNEDGPVAGTVIECARNKPDEATGHPTQKPLRVVEHLVALACAPGGLVLDPFAGSGTTGVVALRLGRSFVGIELNPEYAEMARRRITADAPLFNAAEVRT